MHCKIEPTHTKTKQNRNDTNKQFRSIQPRPPSYSTVTGVRPVDQVETKCNESEALQNIHNEGKCQLLNVLTTVRFFVCFTEFEYTETATKIENDTPIV